MLFAIGRTPGWLAQWLELVQDKEQKIARPKQIYTGDRTLDFVPGLRALGLTRGAVSQVMPKNCRSPWCSHRGERLFSVGARRAGGTSDAAARGTSDAGTPVVRRTGPAGAPR